MPTRRDIIDFCKTFDDVYEDYPFHDDLWTLMRHRRSKRTFAAIYERQGLLWVNVKVSPEWRDFWRSAFSGVVPAYHMNKEHWNSIVFDGSVPEQEWHTMIAESYALIKKQ